LYNYDGKNVVIINHGKNIKIIIHRSERDDSPELLPPRWTGRYAGPTSPPGLGATGRARRLALELRRRRNRTLHLGNDRSRTGKKGACCPMNQ